MTMSRKTGMRGKAIAVICCLALLVGCTGCGALKEGSRRERQSQQGQSSQQGERIASSLKDYARSLLDSDGGKISDQQKSALEKDLESGESAGLRDNRKALTCLVTAGVNVTASDETVWYPLK